MGKGNGLTRGDRRRSERIERLRRLVPRSSAVVAVDLGEDVQMVAVMDHDSRVLARKVVNRKAYLLGEALDWAVGKALASGFDWVTVVCEPTGSRWMPLQKLAVDRGVSFVCVQRLATHVAREQEDYPRDRSDYRDAVLIGRLAAELHCYVPEDADEDWALLGHQGTRRAALVQAWTSRMQQVLDLLGLAGPVVLAAAAKPFESIVWKASVAVVLDRCAEDPARVRRMGPARFTAAVRRELPRWGGKVIRHRIVDAVFTALTDAGGAVPAQRRGALLRAKEAMNDLRDLRVKIEKMDQEMVAQLDVLGVKDLNGSIPGLSAEGAAQILAETGDRHRFDSARAMVKHAGLNPVENTSAALWRGHPNLQTGPPPAPAGGLAGRLGREQT